MNTIRTAAWSFWHTLSNSETKTVYQLALTKTWNLLTQAIQLIMLLLLLLMTVAVWLWSVSFQSGRSLRSWLETENPTVPEIFSEAQQLILRLLRQSINWVQTQLQTRYGLDIKFPELKLLEETGSSGSKPTNSGSSASPSGNPKK